MFLTGFNNIFLRPRPESHSVSLFLVYAFLRVNVSSIRCNSNVFFNTSDCLLISHLSVIFTRNIIYPPPLISRSSINSRELSLAVFDIDITGSLIQENGNEVYMKIGRCNRLVFTALYF